MVAGLIFMSVLSAQTVRQGMCAEDCPLEITNWSPRGIIEDLQPAVKATIRSRCGSDLPFPAIEMIFDGAPVSPEVERDGSEITLVYIPDPKLPAMKTYKVIVRLKDENGNSSEKTWEFHVPFFY